MARSYLNKQAVKKASKTLEWKEGFWAVEITFAIDKLYYVHLSARSLLLNVAAIFPGLNQKLTLLPFRVFTYIFSPLPLLKMSNLGRKHGCIKRTFYLTGNSRLLGEDSHLSHRHLPLSKVSWVN